MKKLTNSQRIKIPIISESCIKFYTKNGLLLANGYTRVVIGGRGPYIEFSCDQIEHDNIYIPKHAEHKLKNSMSYYWEYRSKDKCNVKLYDQKMEVSYADYKVGMWYISPDLVSTDELEDLVLPLYIEEVVEEIEEIEEVKVQSIFDVL